MKPKRFQKLMAMTRLDTSRKPSLFENLTLVALGFAILSAPIAVGSPNSCSGVFSVAAPRSAAHDAIVADLKSGHVVSAVRFSANDNRNELWKVKVSNPETGRFRDALFKPRPYGDADGWNRVPMEYVAYALGRLLEIDAVPPVAYRHRLWVDGKKYAEGALLYLVPDAHRLAAVPEKSWGLQKELFLSDTRILDILLENPDRHIDNFIRGKHWVDGSYRPVLIDHASSLRGRGLRLHHDNAFLTGSVRKIRQVTLRALQRLSLEDLKPLDSFISEKEMRAILARRDQILEDAKNLTVVSSFD